MVESIKEYKRRKHAEYMKQFYWKNRDSWLARLRASSTEQRQARSRREKKWRDKTKLAVFQHYGMFCQCCGEDNFVFLVIDHINGRGEIDRKDKKRAGAAFYAWLKTNGFPTGFQTLCQNCNWAKAMGTCPHHSIKEHLGKYENLTV